MTKTDTSAVFKTWLLTICALVVLLGLFFFPRLPLAQGAKIRIEDLAFVGIFFTLFLMAGKKEIYFDNVMLLPLAYFLYGFAISFVKALSTIGENGFFFLFFWGKEFQYYVFSLLFCYLFSRGRKLAPVTALFFLVSANVVVAIYKLVTGMQHVYGIGAAFLDDSSSLSGQVYFGCLLTAVFLLYLRLVTHRLLRIFVHVLAGASFVACLATGSKSAIFAALSFLLLFLWLNDFISPAGDLRSILRKCRKWMLLSACGALFIYFFYNVLHCRIFALNLGRLINPFETTVRRYLYDIKPKFAGFSWPVDYITGKGYLAGQGDLQNIWFATAYDSQYGRNLLVVGGIGTVLWLLMLWGFARYLRRHRNALIFFLSMLGAYLVMGVGLESFITSKSGPVFWILTGMLVGLAGINDPAREAEPRIP